MHPADNGHDRLAPVPRHAAAVNKQGPRVHPSLLGAQSAEPRRAAAHLVAHTRDQGPRPVPDTDHACRKQVRRERRTERGIYLRNSHTVAIYVKFL